MQAFWSDDKKAIVIIGCQTGKKYAVVYQSITYEKNLTAKANNCGYVKVNGTPDEPLLKSTEISVGGKKVILNSVPEQKGDDKPYCTKKGSEKGEGGSYSMNNAPKGSTSFSYQGDLYVPGFQPEQKVEIIYQMTGNKTKKMKATTGGIIILKDSESYPLNNQTRVTVGGIDLQPLHEDTI
jgi:hypothetical protein